MNIKKCYISSFGKLKNFELELKSGINSFVLNNGYGKTTVCAFIKSMFYGLDSSSRSIESNERLKYRPFNSVSKFGGYIIFDLNGNEYKIERFFGLKESEDEIKYIDLSTNKELSFSGEIGKDIFGVDKNSFLSSTFFSQNNLFFSDLSGVNDVLNLKSGDNDEVLYNKGVNNLNDKLKEYKKLGNKGLIPETKEKISRLNTEIDLLERQTDLEKILKEELNSYNEKINSLNENIKINEEKLENYGDIVKNSLKIENNERLKEELNDLYKTKEELEFMFNGYLPGDNELSAYFTCYEDYKNAQNRVKESAKNTKSSGKSLRKWSILGIIVFLIGFAFIPLNYYITVALSSIGLVLTLVFLFSKGKVKEEKDSGYNEIVTEYENRIGEYLKRFNLSEKAEFYYSLSKLKNGLAIYRETVRKISFIEQKVKENTSDFSSDFNKEFSDKTADISNIQKELEGLRKEKESINYEIFNLNSKLNSLNEVKSDLLDKKSELELLRQNLSEYEKEYDIYYLTLKFLTTANENLRKEIKKPLEESFIKYVSLISEDLSNRTKIDIDLNISVEEDGKTTKSAYYSKGIRVIFEICKRFALIDVLYSKERPIIVIDDSFCDLDAENLIQAKNVIKILSKDYQIIYFTCHSSREIR